MTKVHSEFISWRVKAREQFYARTDLHGIPLEISEELLAVVIAVARERYRLGLKRGARWRRDKDVKARDDSG